MIAMGTIPSPRQAALDCLERAIAGMERGFDTGVSRDYAVASLRCFEVGVQILCCIHEIDFPGGGNEARVGKVAVMAAKQEIDKIKQENSDEQRASETVA